MLNLFSSKRKQIQTLQEENERLKQELCSVLEDHAALISSPKQNAYRLLKVNLDHKNVYLIDYENIMMIPHFVCSDEMSVCYIFIGEHQKAQMVKEERRLEFQGKHFVIPHSNVHKNALDILLSFYLGQIYSCFQPNAIFVISNDSDYSHLQNCATRYPDIPYEQLHMNEIKRKEQNKYSDTFYKRFLLDYLTTFGSSKVTRTTFVKRLRGSKVHGMTTYEVQYALHRMSELHLIEETLNHGIKYVCILEENIKKLSSSVVKFDTSYVY